MGWKISLVVVGEKYEKEVTRLTEDLQLGSSVLEKETTLNQVLSPPQLCMGFYNSCSIISHQAILMDFFGSTPSKMEKEFMNLFHSRDLVVAALNENSGLAGFSYIKKGKRIRTLLEVEDEIVFAVGEPLEEEANKEIYELPFAIPGLLLGRDLDHGDILGTRMSVLRLI